MGIGMFGGLKAGFAALAVCGLAMPALAGGSIKDGPMEEPKRDLQWSANFSATSDYVFRGFSQSKERPAVQGGIDATYKWLYAGIWSSTIDFGDVNPGPGGGPKDIAHAEVDIYAGIKPVLGPVTFDIGVIYYVYPNAFDPGAELDYVEIKVGASGSPWKDATIGVTGFYSPEYTGKTGEVFTIEGAFSQAFAAIRGVTPTWSSTLGYQVGDDAAYRAVFGNGDDSYLYWNSGLTLGFGDNFSLDFRYWDTDVSNSGGFCSARLFGCDERFIATAKVTY
ncbi:MAG: TorF family putative porin [Hyphomicrobiaceae bacterium]